MCSNREKPGKCDGFTEIQIFENLKTITVGQVIYHNQVLVVKTKTQMVVDAYKNTFIGID